jgi:hypothetical protein
MKSHRILATRLGILSFIIVLLFSKAQAYCINPTDSSDKPVTNQTKIDSVAPNGFSLFGALYSNINSIPDNDPSGFSQYYISASIPINARHGIIATSKGWNGNAIWVRNIYLTPTFNASSLNYVPIDSFAGDKHINRLDLYQYAFFKFPINVNILTYIFHADTSDLFHCYLDLLGSIALTKDTSTGGSSTIIPSGLYGLSLSAKSEKDLIPQTKGLIFEAGISVFKINPFSNSVNPDLNLQYRNLSDALLASNTSKSITGIDKWFGEFEATMAYAVNANLTTYLHLNYINNLKSEKSYQNSYFQLQLGASIDVLSFFSKSSPSTKGIPTPGT